VVRLAVGEADEPEPADCELEPHAISESETTAAIKPVGRCIRNCICRRSAVSNTKLGRLRFPERGSS